MKITLPTKLAMTMAVLGGVEVGCSAAFQVEGLTLNAVWWLALALFSSKWRDWSQRTMTRVPAPSSAEESPELFGLQPRQLSEALTHRIVGEPDIHGWDEEMGPMGESLSSRHREPLDHLELES